MSEKLEYEIINEVKRTLPGVADLVKLLAEKECNDVEEVKLLYLSLFVVLINCGYAAINQEGRIDISIKNTIYSANLSTLNDFLGSNYNFFVEKIENRKIENEIKKEKVEEKIHEELTIEVEKVVKEEIVIKAAEVEIEKEEIKESKKEGILIYEKKSLPTDAGTLPPQLMRENYVKYNEGDIYHKKNFIFNRHFINCKKDEHSIAGDKYEVYIFPLEYCNIGSSSKILAAIISEDDRIHYAISQNGKKSIVMDMDEYRFIFSGKWELGKFKSIVTSYAYEEKEFTIASDKLTELNSGIFMEEIGIVKNIDGYKYHFFPLDLKNDENIGTCSFLVLDKQTKEIRISNKNKEIMLVTNGMVQTYHAFWTGDVFNIEQI